MRVKVVDITEATKDKTTTPEILKQIERFAAVCEETQAKGFAAVALTEEGQIIDSWYSRIPPVAMVGAISVLLQNYQLNLIAENLDDE